MTDPIRPALALLVTLAALAPDPATAQIVNVQSQFSGTPADGFHGVLSGSLDWRTGNVDYLSTKLELVGSLAVGRSLVLAAARGEYGIRGDAGDPFLSRVFEHLRYRYRFTDLVSAEGFLQHEYDRFRKLQLRFLTGAGVRLDLVGSETAALAVGLAMMLDHEQLIEGRGQATVGRLSSYALGSITLMENVALSESVYAQPRVDRWSDVRILSETALTLKVNTLLSVGIAFTLAWDADPPDGFDPPVEPLDTQLKTSLSLTF